MSSIQKITILSVVVLLIVVITAGVNSREQHATSKPLAQVNLAVSGEDVGLDALIVTLEKRLPGIEVSDITKSPLNGFYQVFYSGQLLYISADSQFIFTGSLLELAEDAPINHSQLALAEFEARKAPMRAEAIANIKESDMVVYKAPEEKYEITIFTDVDCGYCRKLHREMSQLNQMGVTVRYLAFPRAGVGSDAYKKLVSVWCAEDRTVAMNNAKLKREFTNKSCNNPIADQYRLTRDFGLSGTPAIILSDGELIGGYLPAGDLVKHLQQKAQAAQGASQETVNVNSAK